MPPTLFQGSEPGTSCASEPFSTDHRLRPRLKIRSIFIMAHLGARGLAPLSFKFCAGQSWGKEQNIYQRQILYSIWGTSELAPQMVFKMKVPVEVQWSHNF